MTSVSRRRSAACVVYWADALPLTRKDLTVALPTLTPEQRAAALAKAAEARKARSELLATIKSGKQTIASVLNRAKDDDTVGKTKVVALLKAVPGVGAVKAAALLEQAGIDPSRRAKGLGDRQRTMLIDALT
jgi:S13-like protein